MNRLNSTDEECLTVAQCPWSFGLELRFGVKEFGKDKWNIAQPIVFEERPNGAPVEPFMFIRQDTVQKLMDNLWDMGFRPSKEYGGAGALGAMKEHLEDLRKLVFK